MTNTPGDSTTSAERKAARVGLLVLCMVAVLPRHVECGDSSFDECGGIRTWNLLGAYDSPGREDIEEAEIRADYMTDGQIGERDFLWRPGATIRTDFNVAASSTITGPADRNPNGVPTVFAHTGENGWIDLQSTETFADDETPDPDFVMAYAQVYVVAEHWMPVFFGISSDDSIQVLIEQPEGWKEVWIHSRSGAGSSACFPQDEPFNPIVLERGYTSLIVKVFEAEGLWDFSLRFQDEFGDPITAGLSTSLEPEGWPPATFRRGDCNDDGTVNLSDGVCTLNWLFLGADDPGCMAAIDTNGTGNVDLSDAVLVFDHLFLGGPPPVAPFPDCGPIPAGETLTCVEPQPCKTP